MEITPRISILLPMCIESGTDDRAKDVFLIILKNIVARKNFEENDLLIAFKEGMYADKLLVDLDITKNWKGLKSKTQQYLQSKLMGFWAIQNYPLLGKKFFGDRWKAHQRRSVEIVRDSRKIEPNEFDKIIFEKIKLTVIELSVSESTVDKLKCFVKVPASIGKHNPVQISQKMVLFDINNEYLEICWESLKHGEFLTKGPPFSMAVRDCSVVLDRAVQQLNGEQIEPVDLSEDSSATTHDSESGSSTKRARRNHNLYHDSSNSSFEMMVEIRNNVRSMTKWFNGVDPKEADKLKIEMSEKVAQLEEERNAWARYATSKEEELDGTKVELSAEKIKLDNSEKLQFQMTQKIQDMCAEQTNKGRELKEVMDELSAVKIKLDELAKLRLETFQKVDEKEGELKTAKDDLAAAKTKLYEAEKLQLEMAQKVVWNEGELKAAKDEMAQLEQQRNAWAGYASSKENELDVTKKELARMAQKVKDLEREQGQYVESKKIECEEAKNEKNAVIDKNRKLEEEFMTYKKTVESMIPELQSRIEELERNATTTKNDASEDQEAQTKQCAGRPRRRRQINSSKK